MAGQQVNLFRRRLLLPLDENATLHHGVMSWLVNKARTLLRLPSFRPNLLNKDSLC